VSPAALLPRAGRQELLRLQQSSARETRCQRPRCRGWRCSRFWGLTAPGPCFY